MNIQQISSIYGDALTDKFLDIFYSVSVDDLINNILHYMPKDVLHDIMASLEIESEL